MIEKKKYTENEIDEILSEIKDDSPITAPEGFTEKVMARIESENIVVNTSSKPNTVVLRRITAVAASFVVVILGLIVFYVVSHNGVSLANHSAEPSEGEYVYQPDNIEISGNQKNDAAEFSPGSDSPVYDTVELDVYYSKNDFDNKPLFGGDLEKIDDTLYRETVVMEMEQLSALILGVDSYHISGESENLLRNYSNGKITTSDSGKRQVIIMIHLN